MTENKNIPKHWQIKKLGEIAKWGSGGTPTSTNSSYYNGEIPWLIIGDLNDGYINNSEKRITKSGIDNSSAKIVKPESVLIAMYGSIGKLGINKIPVATNQAIAFTSELYDFISNKYLFHYLFSIRPNLHGLGKGGTQKNISQSVLKEVSIPIPPLPEQLAIVSKIEELLSDLDNGKQQLLTAQQQLKVYRQSLLKAAFEGKLTAGCREAQKQKENEPMALAAEPEVSYRNNGKLPEGWKLVDLKSVCSIKRGKSKHRPRNDSTLYGGKYPFIQTGDIRNARGGYISTYSQTYNEKGLFQSYLWPTGTLCITIAANIGETAILRFEACFPDSVVGLVCDEKKILNKFCNYFFISYKSKLEELAPATAQKNINVDILEKVRIPLPIVDEQKIVVELLESKLTVCDKIEETIAQSLLQAETLRQSILKRAFEGKLVNHTEL
jgi:type I restriction enzyme S subunit